MESYCNNIKFNPKSPIKCQLLTILNMVNLQEGIAIVADMAMPKELLALHPHVVKRPLSPNTQRADWTCS